ncbi:MFS transporter [Streptomyces sp. AD681]|uniref:MFS transporter n=1 Tax=Streptomyces sp. AD681 TaxID=3019069 RepID=UPI0022F1830D|nr:MFS transporter [Streptomyces sp. AD681]MDA5141618.1 MFS transporter [Streptomyces sp. AD681]
MNVSSKTTAPDRGRAATIALACAGVFVAYLPVTTVAVSLPAVQEALGASTAQLSWVSDAFVLPVAALILTAGVFGDVHGRRRVYQVGLALCAAGALVSLCAGSVQVLWAGQALAGAGAAALLPVTLALISQAVPYPRERGKYIGWWTTCMMAAMVVGPLVAGVVVRHTDWRWIFLLPVPASLVTMAVAARLLPESRAAGGRRLDWPGQISAAVAITALVYGVIEGGADSFTAPRALAALAVAVVSGWVFVVVERRSAAPMLDLSLFRSPAFTASTLVALVSFLGLIGFFFVLSLYLGLVQQLDTWQAGIRMVLVNVVSMFMGVAMGRVMQRVPARALITAGLLVTAGALLSLTTLDADTSYASLAWRLALLGLGLGIAFPCITSTAVSAVPGRRAGMAAAGNNAFRQVGGALGPAVLGALLTTRAMDTLPGRLADAGVTGDAARTVVGTAEADGLGAVTGLDLGPRTARALGAASEAFLDGLYLCLSVSAALLVLAAGAAAFLLRPRPDRTVTDAPAGHATPAGADGPETRRVPAPRPAADGSRQRP